MDSHYGTVVSGIITDDNEQYFFVQKDGVTYAMDKQENEDLTIGDIVQGFVYESTAKKRRLTTILPKSQIGKYGFGIVTQVRKDLGVFVDIGLKDKEIVVSMDDLPQLTHLWPKKQDKLMISLTLDKKERLWGQLASDAIFKSVAKKGTVSHQNQDVEGVVFRLKLVGTYILTRDFYIGFIHPSERVDEPRLGEIVSGRVIGVRPDGILNISLRQRAHEAIGDDAQMILAMLRQEPTQQLPFGDKSDPEAIKVMFGISKGQFKRALGHLLKQRLITAEDEMIRLVEQ